MAKVGLENDTLKPPKCPSNWEYSTGQRQLLDIQSGEQMDRVSFSAQRTKDSIKLSFFCAFRGRVRDHIDNPSKPPFDKGGFVLSGKRDSPRSTPSCPLSGGVGGINNSSRICPQMRTRGLFSAQNQVSEKSETFYFLVKSTVFTS